jgi:tRNA U34 5-methylaminomethyl-2-thiouridine-forming methyltransferase MnmC
MISLTKKEAIVWRDWWFGQVRSDLFWCFGYRATELWSTAIFKKMYDALKNNGVLVTYAARGVVKEVWLK